MEAGRENIGVREKRRRVEEIEGKTVSDVGVAVGHITKKLWESIPSNSWLKNPNISSSPIISEIELHPFPSNL